MITSRLGGAGELRQHGSERDAQLPGRGVHVDADVRRRRQTAAVAEASAGGSLRRPQSVGQARRAESARERLCRRRRRPGHHPSWSLCRKYPPHSTLSTPSGPRATARPVTHCIRTARDKLVGPRAGK